MSELIDHVASEAGLEKAQARRAVDAFVSAISGAAKSGDSVALAGFGQFKVKDSPARQGRNPATGQTIEIAAAQAGVRTGQGHQGRAERLNSLAACGCFGTRSRLAGVTSLGRPNAKAGQGPGLCCS